ncbi:MAG: hypothetical protein M5U28_14925 [Sandaracinaceae bacterium]|nr:hypothetical protein [Sandaracinaceae bacterium]
MPVASRASSARSGAPVSVSTSTSMRVTPIGSSQLARTSGSMPAAGHAKSGTTAMAAVAPSVSVIVTPSLRPSTPGPSGPIAWTTTT